ncbi:hypothetical protein [Paenibacillus sp.]|uniref:hypothetical protein n=1 Tax=Paenibacillus sp. TaxID=58172 RepID=UPI002D48B117|nr:hypothetical protein [Paenibacillus sp.]HZG57106.1 hypothetical protein [Paenibacillus sp.]
MNTFMYEMKVKELDEGTTYPVDVLAGMTGLGFDTIRRLEREGKFTFVKNGDGAEAVRGKEFLDWAKSVGNKIEVEKTDYSHSHSH